MGREASWAGPHIARQCSGSSGSPHHQHHPSRWSCRRRLFPRGVLL